MSQLSAALTLARCVKYPASDSWATKHGDEQQSAGVFFGWAEPRCAQMPFVSCFCVRGALTKMVRARPTPTK